MKLFNQNNRAAKFYLLSLALIILDQASKLYIKGFTFLGVSIQGMREAESIRVLGDFFRITYVENAGMAFSLSFGEFKYLLSIFSIVASILLIWYVFKLSKFDWKVQLAATMILSGAVGNLIDRVFYGVIFGYDSIFWGRVVDFLDFDFFHFTILGRHYDRFPVFNIADSCVTIGICLMVIFNSKIPTFKKLIGKEEINNNEIKNERE